MALLPPYSADEAQLMEPVQQNLFFEGFLRKRKDTMKFTWAKYWFKLQNTTLYFYTTRDAQPCAEVHSVCAALDSRKYTFQACLRGQYYMYSVQSVRKVASPDGDFTFEIVMKNGKKKLLSADSEDLQDVWIKLLWKSMQLPGPGHSSSSCTWYDIPDLIQRGHLAALDGNICPQSQCEDSFKNPPESTLQRGSTSAVDEYDFPNSTQAVQAIYSGNEDDASPESNIYDIPKSLINPYTAPAAPDAAPPAFPVLSCEDETRCSSPEAAQEQDNMQIKKLSLCDSPALEKGEHRHSGAETQYMAMTDMGIYDSPVPDTLQRLAGSVTTGMSDA